VFGAFAFGAALTYPYWGYPYYGYPYYSYPYPAYAAPQPAVVYQQQPQAVGYQPPAGYRQTLVEREVVYPHGKYVLYGDGVNQPWQWVWVPATVPPTQ